MLRVWDFPVPEKLSRRKTVEKIRRNTTLHGGGGGRRRGGGGGGGVVSRAEACRPRQRGKEKEARGKGSVGAAGFAARRAGRAHLSEREGCAERGDELRHLVQRQRKELRRRCWRFRGRNLKRRGSSIENVELRERDSQRSRFNTADAIDDFHANSEKRKLFTRLLRTKYEVPSQLMKELVIHLNPQLEAAKLGIDFDGEIPDDVKAIATNALRNPPLLLQAVTAYTSRLKTLIHREMEKIDIRADAELLRYKFENNRVTDAASPDVSSSLHYQANGNGKIGFDVSSKGTHNQLLERQKAHVQQFVATEDALNKAAEARNLSQKLIKRLHGSSVGVSSDSIPAGTSQNLGSLRHFELDVWSKEREVAGLRASLNTLTTEVQRLNKLCAEWKEAEDSLRKKWKKIEEFDSRRSELESIYAALLRANMDAATFWDQQPLAAREYASSTIVPACAVVVDISTNAKDLIEKEVSAFSQSPDNSLYMLPSTPQALLEFMGSNGSAGPEAVAAAERNAALLTARAGARDPSAVPSICRVSAALQDHSGLEGPDAGLALVLESLEFCLKLRGSEASVLEDLSKAINLVHIRQDLVESGHALLNHAYRVQQEYERTTNYCLSLAADQEKTVSEKWLPELKTAVLNAQKCLEDCKRVRGLVDEWWEQPAATAVDWVTVDGQNVAAWLNHVKQLQMAFYDKELL
ncbi:AUGMIN subunit 5 [Cinnamomum micranthum f. kanehirae]|uniref:AUGMIN subunit 5 n=1 Tax=Cinnamomum micranthum f. kanehirae TaxID=337451 RepID=A0A443NBZ5_9MAGN|nr:AUGMIN subunit 5 [Cinnamomum micranthum f. kanehirae]